MAVQPQIIGGQSYPMYSPQWYAARDANKIQQAGVAGTAAGTTAGSALTALQDIVPGALTPNSGSSSSSGASASGVPATVNYGTGGAGVAPMPGGAPGVAGGAPSLDGVDTSAARSAVWNQAKDRVGQTSRAALTGLRSELASRGQLGGGGEYRGTSSIINAGQQQLADTGRAQTIDEAKRLEDEVALRYQGGISMRGQDLSAENAAYQGLITQRGQDITARGQDISAQAGQSSYLQNVILEALRSLQY
jgi:hypothetical protein